MAAEAVTLTQSADGWWQVGFKEMYPVFTVQPGSIKNADGVLEVRLIQRP
jgi:hypothetical protein